MASISGAGSDEEYTGETGLSNFTRTIGFIGLAAAVPWTLSCMTLKHRASIRICTATAATCGVLGSLTNGTSSSHSRNYQAAVKNTSSEHQPNRETQRYPGLRGGVIFGALASILMLRRLPARARIYRRTLVASTCGVAAAYTAYRTTEARNVMNLAGVLKPGPGLESTSFAELSATIKEILSMAVEDPMLHPADGTMAASRGPLVDQGSSSTSDSGSGSSGRGSSLDGAPQAQGGREEGGPLTASKPPFNIGVRMSASTNYQWTSENPIADLERSLKRLTENRKKLAREAEFLWSWLSVKELEYYNHYYKLADCPEKRSKRYYLHTLSQIHFVLWQKATATDWRIADTKKHMSRLRSLDANGNMTWCIEQSAEAAVSRPEQAMWHFRDCEQDLAKKQAHLQQLRRNMAEMLLGFDEAAQNEQIYDPEKKKMVSQKDMFVKVRDSLEREVNRVDESQQVVRQLIIDAKRRGPE
ncbi:hypothetical protein CKM354_000334900 [Cercospora kikuchii]|uniref:Uncharacterized protein n=1 Tax=Cercospora kikuchii TaxID=84275 RepID=A0A9P3FEY9_9PEZI|nr:uncharacterized protein CKM354_000334900 [Cercospora kikuchii]GIZ39990.1 hypothetical protein CKM354_000334900 [Cercospora kikuchii]